ncbi:trypsin-like peptidase domain-containing protein [candidate division CSSED10-310 bacterium]|uniref:Trypsin-like peptidase domain-containing protein n=1 Tax=candidate division CSSED10-310 bacterium TaxID=2855610 RepID=A0ABV6YSV3_UNCC1
MSNEMFCDPVSANLFHEGNTCPFCQETIVVGQLIVQCQSCGSFHHETCWRYGDGCSSYYCGKSTAADADHMTPELVITPEDLEKLPLPSRAVQQSTGEAGLLFLPTKPTELSKLAVISLVLSGLSILGIGAVLIENLPLMIIGIVIALTAIVLGVISMVIINTKTRLYGMKQSSSAIIVATIMILVLFFSLNRLAEIRNQHNLMDLDSFQKMPTEEELNQMPTYFAQAMRANVAIRPLFSTRFTTQSASGSGVILRCDHINAFIVTNKHVVTNKNRAADSIRVLFYNGEKRDATIEWMAPGEIDLTIISCPGLVMKDYTPVQLTDNVIKQGDVVFAIGNPMNLYWSFTKGVISGIRSRRMNDREIVIYQTQTPINYGNSGGGLYDMTGLLIGINTWTQDKSISEGLSFAFSIKCLTELLSEKERKQYIAKPANNIL